MVHSKPPICRVHLFAYVFAPRTLPTILTLLVLPILISLGFWQLDRAEQKQRLITGYYSVLHNAPSNLSQLIPPWTQWRFYPVKASGYYDNEHTMFLDNKFYQHRVGYHVVTPFVLDNHKMILVNRGWIPLQNRQLLPSIKPVQGKQNLTGFIDIPNPKPFLLNHKDETEVWPRRIQAIEIQKLSFAKNLSTYPVIVLLSPQANNGFIRDWQPVTLTMPPARHTAYAIQWFSLALTLLIIFVVVNTKRHLTHAI